MNHIYDCILQCHIQWCHHDPYTAYCSATLLTITGGIQRCRHNLSHCNNALFMLQNMASQFWDRLYLPDKGNGDSKACNLQGNEKCQPSNGQGSSGGLEQWAACLLLQPAGEGVLQVYMTLICRFAWTRCDYQGTSNISVWDNPSKHSPVGVVCLQWRHAIFISPCLVLVCIYTIYCVSTKI